MVDLIDSKGITTIRGCKPSPRFQKYFDQCNKKYFENRIGPTIVYVAPMLKITSFSQKQAKDERNWAEAGLYGITGTNPDGQQCIILDKGTAVFHSILAKQTVLHESIHIYLGFRYGHGRIFKAQIRRIAALGALDNLI